MFDKKDRELAIRHESAVIDLESALRRLKKHANEELTLALEYVDDTHMPYDAVARLAKEIVDVQEILKRVADAHSELVNYRFNRH